MILAGIPFSATYSQKYFEGENERLLARTFKWDSLNKKILFSSTKYGFCIATHFLEKLSLKHNLISGHKKNCSLWLGRYWFVRYKVQQSLVGKVLAWADIGWEASAVDKQPFVGSFHTLLCQYCDRRDAEWHCHWHCQRPVTFAPVVWEWWRRERDMQRGRHTGRREQKDKQRKYTEIKGKRTKKRREYVTCFFVLIPSSMNHPQIPKFWIHYCITKYRD